MDAERSSSMFSYILIYVIIHYKSNSNITKHIFSSSLKNRYREWGFDRSRTPFI